MKYKDNQTNTEIEAFQFTGWLLKLIIHKPEYMNWFKSKIGGKKV